MARVAVVLALLAAAMLAAPAVATIDYSRVHLVAQSPENSGFNNFLFRGNMPTNDTDKDHPTFAYDTLISYMRKRAAESGVKLPQDLYLIDISLNNPFDGPDFWAEEAFWKDGAHKDLGMFINWPLGLAGIIPPSAYSLQKRYEMANSSVWKVDRIPTRIADIHTMLVTKYPASAVIYVHCSAGCDRTGEVIGSYRLEYVTTNLTEMYALDTSECGRSPNYWSTSALEWFCYYWMDHHNYQNIGSCTGFASCHLFGKCHPTGEPMLTEEQQLSLASWLDAADRALPGHKVEAPFVTPTMLFEE